MTMKERALSLIGLEGMSNREALLEELSELTSEQLYDQFADNRLTQLIDDLKCEDCHRMHGGQCPMPEEDDCALTLAQWLDMPCTRERLIEVAGDE